MPCIIIVLTVGLYYCYKASIKRYFAIIQEILNQVHANL